MKIPALAKIDMLPPFKVGTTIRTTQGRQFIVTTILQVYKEDQEGMPQMSWDLVLVDADPNSHTYEN